jgi:hypothetical protein
VEEISLEQRHLLMHTLQLRSMLFELESGLLNVLERLLLQMPDLLFHQIIDWWLGRLWRLSGLRWNGLSRR